MRFGLGHIQRGKIPAPRLQSFLLVGPTNNIGLGQDLDTISYGQVQKINLTATDCLWVEELGKYFIVHGAGDAAAKLGISTDGIHWDFATPTGIPAIAALTGLAWSPELELLVTVGNSNAFYYSEDGVDWTEGTHNGSPGENIGCVTWSPELEKFVALANSGTGRIRTSTDGIDWTSTTQSEVDAVGWFAIQWCSGLGRFIACGAISGAGVYATSEDGLSWDVSDTDSRFSTLNDIAYSPKQNVALIGGTSPTVEGVTRYLRTTDGEEFDDEVIEAEFAFNCRFGWLERLGVFVAVVNAGSGRFRASIDGLNFVYMTPDLDTANAINKIVPGPTVTEYLRFMSFGPTDPQSVKLPWDFYELDIECWGGGGGTGGVSQTTGTSATAGGSGSSSVININDVNLIAGGGTGSQSVRGDTGGTGGGSGGAAINGDVNIPGEAGATGVRNDSFANFNAAGRYGAGTANSGNRTGQTTQPTSNSTTASGTGQTLGGGGRPPATRSAGAAYWVAGGGGGGGYVKKTYTRGGTGVPEPGDAITFTVGAGGTAGAVTGGSVAAGGGAGSPGRIIFTMRIAADKGSSYVIQNTQTETLLADAAFDGQIVADKRKRLYDHVMGRLVNSGQWDNIDAFYIPIGKTEAIACINWKNPGTYTLQRSGGGYIADEGFNGSGSLDTQFNPTTAGGNFTQNSAGIGIAVGPSSVVSFSFVNHNISPGLIFSRVDTDLVWRVNSGTSSTLGSVPAGFPNSWHAYRSSSTSVTIQALAAAAGGSQSASQTSTGVMNTPIVFNFTTGMRYYGLYISNGTPGNNNAWRTAFLAGTFTFARLVSAGW